MKNFVLFIWADFVKGDGTEEGEKHLCIYEQPGRHSWPAVNGGQLCRSFVERVLSHRNLLDCSGH